MPRSEAPSAKKVIAELRALGNPADAAHALRFFKTGKGQYGEGDQFLGIRVPLLRRQAKFYLGLNLAQQCELLQSPFHEVRLLALLLMVASFNRGDTAQQKAIYQAYLQHSHRVNNWDLVDSSAHHIVGGYLHGRDKSVLRRLARSSLLWERRIAIIACFYDIKRNEFECALEIASLLLQDQHDLMHKAVGWMLREVGKRDVKSERMFLDQHYRGMPRTMLRYAIERFPEPLRQRYLLGKV